MELKLLVLVQSFQSIVETWIRNQVIFGSGALLHALLKLIMYFSIVIGSG